MTQYLLIILLSYFIGSISFSVIFSKKFAGFDVREKGSKNAGTTNVLRTVGKKAGALTFICDVLKGVLAVAIAGIIGKIWEGTDYILLQYIAGFSVILGHTYPIFFEFRGGKGVATIIGVLLMLNPQVALICLTFGIILIAITKMVSVGSVLSAILYPILILFVGDKPNIYVLMVSILTALLIIFNHRENIKRIKNGTENKLSFKK